MGNALRCFRSSRRDKYVAPSNGVVPPVVEVRFAPLVLPDDDIEYIDIAEEEEPEMSSFVSEEAPTQSAASEGDVTPSMANLSHAMSFSSSTSEMEVERCTADSAKSQAQTSSQHASVPSCSGNGNERKEHCDAEQSTSKDPSSKPAATRVNGGQRRFFDVTVNTIRFSIPEGYSQKLEYIGGGSYGNVVKTQAECRDGQSRLVTVKKLKDPFYDALQARRIYREIKLLQLMNHGNIISAMDLYTPDSLEHDFKDVYVVTEFAGRSISKLLRIQQEQGTTIITPSHAQFIVYQLLRALKYIHSANIMHRDLKPSNLALTDDTDLTVLDFGLARSLERKDTGLTQYVMTRWYRSPEVIYWNIDSYSTQADIWSVGCIAAELMLGKPLFTGEDANAQYDMITRIVGSPDEELMCKIEQNNSPAMRMVIDSLEKHDRVDFATHFGSCDAEFVDFLDNILVLDPERRLTVEEALRHPYVKMYYDPDDEPVADFTLDDDVERSVEEWKGIIWQEIHNFAGDESSPKIVTSEN